MKLIDISHALDGKTPVYPGDCKTIITKYKTLAEDHYNAYNLFTGLHTGTHIDMPMHLLDDERTAADFPAERFIGKGVLLDVRDQDPVMMLSEYEEIDFADKLVLLYTGYDRYYIEKIYFQSYPKIDMGLAKYLASQRIKLLGIDAPAPDYPPFEVHRLLLSQGIFILENLTNLQALKGNKDFDVIALPLKLEAEASPVRAVCSIG